MADEIGIPFARDARGLLFDRWAIERSPEPFVRPLRCGGCPLAVHPVHRYPQQRGATTAVVTPFYRRAAKQDHAPGCTFDFKNRAAEIIVQSRGAVVNRRGLYRLLVPDLDEYRPPGTDPAPVVARPRARLVIRASPTRLHGEALNSAARIGRLLRTFDDDPETVAQFCAVYGGLTVAWPDFYVTPDRMASTAQRIEAGLAHPLVIHAVARQRGTSTRGDTYFVSSRTTQRRLVDGQHRLLTATVRTRNKDIFDMLYPGTPFLAFGWWTLFAAPRSRYVEVQLWAHARWNVSTDVAEPRTD